MVSAGTDATAGGSVISLPTGGGAVSGLGEKFAPDLFTGTGNFSVPITLPSGRLGVQPQVRLAYSNGNGNGVLGLGWVLSLPGVARKTSRGVPRYRDGAAPDGERPDTFVVSGAEDLVAVSGAYPGRVRYRPRTEGLFARIEHVRDATGDYWEVRSKDGMFTRYGMPRPANADAGWRDPAVTADSGLGRAGRVFAWKITETRDVLGNLIRYSYVRDQGDEAGHVWDQPLLSRIEYADYGDRAAPSFLVRVDFDYEPRPDPFSDYRAGFELRTTLRCRAIRVSTHAADGVARAVREHRFGYEQDAFNGASLLTRVEVVGVDQGAKNPYEPLPPLTFGYTDFDPARRRFRPVTGPELPTGPLSDASMALVDRRGNGLPDIVELGASPRYWSNRGDGRFDLPRSIGQAPPYRLGEPGVRFLDADGDGRADLLVSSGAVAGYFPLSFSGEWSRRSFRPYRQAPSIGLDDPSVRLVDLDGDGLTDVLWSGSRLQCWFNDPDPHRAWQRTAVATGPAPDVDLADPRIRLADMTGDGLQDIVLLRNGNIAYWPNLGHGRFGHAVQMRRAPRLPEGYDPRRVLLGDVNGDGIADLVYVDHGRVLVWGNQTGNAWSPQPVVIPGTPDVVDTDTIQLTDLHGTGMAGLLYSRAANGSGQTRLRFLDFTGGRKPYLLETMDNHLGARTKVQYLPSTVFFLRDQAEGATRWRTTLPFPVHVVARVEVYDQFSTGTLTTEYRYHHGYWDGIEREFRGFGMVEQLDTETFPHAGAGGPPGVHYSPPTLTKSWFHLGPVAAVEAGDWTELDLRHEYWPGDAPILARPAEMTAFLDALPRRVRRDALRALRGQLLRTELYALDGTDRQDRPYTVTESLSGVREESSPVAETSQRERIFFPFGLGQRTTQWERGVDPMTQLAFTAGHDAYGFGTQQLAIAVPRGRDPRTTDARAVQPYLATYTTTEYARRDDTERYLVDRVARTTSYEVSNSGQPSVFALRDTVLAGPAQGGPVSLRVIGHSRSFYDGLAYTGLPLGQLGDYGLVVRTESLAFPDSFLDELFDPADPATVSPRPAYLNPGGATAWGAEYPDEFHTLMPALAGYVHYRDTDLPGSPGGYYIISARHLYDVHDPNRVPRGLLLRSLDPLGAQSRIAYDDPHSLFATATADPAGLVTRAGYDLRMLAPRGIRDANGNLHTVRFSPAGFVTAHYVRGKNREGDATAPSTRLDYDLLAFAERGQPASVRSTRRVHHDTDAPADQRNEVIVSVEYSDGFGRTLQTRTQAEDTLFGDPVFGGAVIPADQTQPVTATVGRTRQPSDSDNVVVSGWQIYDNKGRVVEKYEPFFATGWDFAAPREAELGQKTTLFYDPRGQLIRTLNPDGSEQRVVFGVPVDLSDPDVFAPTPWESFTYDANDNAGRTHPTEAQPYAGHWNTPASIEIDALGRTVSSVARNGPTSTDWFTTRSVYDIQGNLIAITDAVGRKAFQYRFDLIKRRWRMDSIDAGRRDSIPDALGHPVEARDSKGALTLGAFDVLHRPIRVWARDDTAGPVTLRQMIEYGDGGIPDQPPAERDAARARNLLGCPTRHHDDAGLVTIAAVDFKGNVLESVRRVIADAPILATYERDKASGWQVVAFQVEWTPAPGQTQTDRDAELLEPGSYVTTTDYDALNRVTRHAFPSDVKGQRRELHPTYNRAGTLDQVRLDDTTYVQQIAYDAKGQRTLIAYGNKVMTRYAYDPHTFRLARLRTEHYTGVDELTYRPTGEVLQDYGYDYDLVGNILTLRDRTPGSGIPHNPDALATTDPTLRALLGSGDALDRKFSYDPIYRLLTAIGREHQAPPSGDPWIDLPRGTDITKTQPYLERYRYDAVGNMLTLGHGGAAGFTRTFTIATDSNRLSRMTIGTTPYDYTFDANGNLIAETTTRHFTWNHADQLKSFATQTAGAEPSVHAQYLYDATGMRVKKLVRRQGGAVEVTHYLDEIFEHHRWSGSTAGENNHLHIMHDQRRIALVRTGIPHPDDRGPAIAFHLVDHLASSTVVIDGFGTFTNREEYTPYGETSFGSFAKKRYRFTGKERDEESGLSYHSARYCASWLGRWINNDPLEVEGGTNLFAYAFGNPTRFVDPLGTQPTEEPPLVGHETIEVTGTAAPVPDAYGSAVSGGAARPLATEEEHKNNLAAEINSRIYDWTLEGQRQAFEWQWNREEAQANFDKFARSNFEEMSERAIAELEKQQRIMGAAYRIAEFIANAVVEAIPGGPQAKMVVHAIDSYQHRDDPVDLSSIDPASLPLPELPLLEPLPSGRLPANYRYAGRHYELSPELRKKYPAGVRFTEKGYPDFGPHALFEVRFPKPGFTGNRTKDFAMANKKAGLLATPTGYTWHHHEDGRTMQLVPTDLHDAIRHAGGVALKK
jgi:RHS repeat-associated protein